MGEVDIAKQAPNVTRMKILGAKVVPVSSGLKTLKEAVDSAFESYAKNYKDSIYCIGSALGPHPFPLMVRDFQSVVGYEARDQFLEMTGIEPDVVAGIIPSYLDNLKNASIASSSLAVSYCTLPKSCR